MWVLFLVAQVWLTLRDPMECSWPCSSVHGDSPGKNPGVICHALLQGNLLNPGFKPTSPAQQADSLVIEPPWKSMDVKVGCKENWAPRNWCFWTVVLEKTLVSPLDCKEIKPVHPKGDQSWIFIGRTDVKVEVPILWPPDAKSWLIRKDHDAGKDWRQEEKGTTEHEMVGWYDWPNGREFEQAPGDAEGQGSLACYSPWGHKESDMTEQLNNI